MKKWESAHIFHFPDVVKLLCNDQTELILAYLWNILQSFQSLHNFSEFLFLEWSGYGLNSVS